MPNGSSVISAHLAEHGLVYVPAACANRTGPAEAARREAGPGVSTTAARVAGPAVRHDGCDVHVHYHGCATPVHNPAGGLVGSYGWQFAAWSGYHEWAEANHIIVLHPQVTPRRDLAEITPRSRRDHAEAWRPPRRRRWDVGFDVHDNTLTNVALEFSGASAVSTRRLRRQPPPPRSRPAPLP